MEGFVKHLLRTVGGRDPYTALRVFVFAYCDYGKHRSVAGARLGALAFESPNCKDLSACNWGKHKCGGSLARWCPKYQEGPSREVLAVLESWMN